MRTTMAVIRLADEADAGAMLAIYAPYVRETAISFELEPPSEGEFRRRVRSVLEAGLWLLCEAGGNALGYAYAGRFHERRAYRWTVEVTAYVHADHHRKGVGLGLYTSLLVCRAVAATAAGRSWVAPVRALFAGCGCIRCRAMVCTWRHKRPQ